MSARATWLHFIGRRWYPTPAAFASEAKRLGVTRRVSILELSRMAWGDEVLCAMRDGSSSLVFGRFIIETLSGVSAELMSAVADLLGRDAVVVDPGGQEVERGCGSFVTGLTVAVPELTLAELADTAKLVDPGKLMVGGRWLDRGYEVRLADVPHRRGFRLFDREAFDAAVNVTRETFGSPPTRPRIHGQFYVDNAEAAELVQGRTNPVYRRCPDPEPLPKVQRVYSYEKGGA